MTRTIGGLGWVRDLPDPRDHVYSAPSALLTQLPTKVDLRKQCPAVYNQGRIGSCTANAIAGAIQFDRLKSKQVPDFVPSRLFIYYNERAMEGHVGFDSGAQLRDGIKVVAKLGVCPEPEWPYDDTPARYDGGPFPSGAADAKKPSAKAYKDALPFAAVEYQRLNQTHSQLKGCLADGYPFVLGFAVFASFWSGPGQQAKVTPMPTGSEDAVGGHAVLAVGYDDAHRWFICRNSWGPSQADKGYFFLPYDYALDPDLSSDFWTIRAIKD